MLKLRSVSNIAIAPARTCNDSSNNRAVMAIVHTNSGIRSGFTVFGFMLIVVETKFSVPKIDDKKCRSPATGRGVPRVSG